MKTMKMRREPSPLESCSSEETTLLHRCPVCSTMHEVSAVRAQFAYGRQLTCSPDCEAERRRRSRAAYRLALAQVPGNVLAECGVRYSTRKVSPSLKLITPGHQPSSTGLKTATLNHSGRDPLRQSTLRIVGVDEQKAVLSVTVESADVLQIRHAIFQMGGQSVGIFKTTPVPHSSRVRVFIGMKLAALEPIMTAIMRSVPVCEFGRIART